ncbi:MAG: sugar phosphate isomerase/epimerase [Fuerstiella sp.]|nr:sugar phosphate isomerase/epimerase [Fuerstiella sp.]
MDVFLKRQPNGTYLPPQTNQELLQSEPLHAQSLLELIDEIAELKSRNVRLVSIRRQQVIRLGQRELQNVLAGNGIDVGAIGYAGGFTGTLGRNYESAVADILRALELAASFNAQSVVVVPGSRTGHTCNHASNTIQAGLDRCLDDALRYRIDLQIALNNVIGGRDDVFVPKNESPLDWVTSLGSHRMKGLMVLRGGDPWKCLPDCWRRCLLSGGVLRLSRSCRQMAGTGYVISCILSGLNKFSTTTTENVVVSNSQ